MQCALSELAWPGVLFTLLTLPCPPPAVPSFALGSTVRNPRKPNYGRGTIIKSGTRPGTWFVEWAGFEA